MLLMLHCEAHDWCYWKVGCCYFRLYCENLGCYHWSIHCDADDWRCFNFYCSATRIPLFIIAFLLASLLYLLLGIAWIIVLPAIGHLLLMTQLWNCEVENFISTFCQLSAVVWWCHRLIKVMSLHGSPRFSPSIQVVNVQWPDDVTLAFLPSSMRVGRLTAGTGIIQLS